MENSFLSALTTRDIASIFTASHFEVNGSTSLGSAHKGTRPGHPYVDVVFSFALHHVLKALAIDLDTDDLRPRVPTASFTNGELQQGQDVRLPIPAFFGDFVLMVTAATPEELIPKCARVLETNRESICIAGHGSQRQCGKDRGTLTMQWDRCCQSKRCHCNRNPEDCHRAPRLRLP